MQYNYAGIFVTGDSDKDLAEKFCKEFVKTFSKEVTYSEEVDEDRKVTTYRIGAGVFHSCHWTDRLIARILKKEVKKWI